MHGFIIFILPLEPFKACFITDGFALFDFFWTVEQKHPSTAILTLAARIIFSITRLEEESHIHLACLVGE